MSTIPPNIIASVLQAPLAAADAAKPADAQRTKRARDSGQLARLADQQEHEVKDTDHTEGLRVHREDERRRDGQDAQDAYEEHARNQPAGLYHPSDPAVEPTPPLPDATPDEAHIDVSA